MDFSRRGKKERWAPEYRTGEGRPYLIEFDPMPECPVSYIHPESQVLVAQLSRTEFAHTATGATLYGDSLAEWPPAMVEAAIALRSETNRVENGAHEIEMLYRKAQTPIAEDSEE